jgi:hypothetical protein
MNGQELKLHLNWDSNQSNGMIMNSRYPWGALFTGIHLRPATSFDYDLFQYSEHFTSKNYILFNGFKRDMTADEEEEIREMARDWIQEEGQEGRPTEEQRFQHYKKVAVNSLAMTGFLMDKDILTTLDRTEKNLLKEYRASMLDLLVNTEVAELPTISPELAEFFNTYNLGQLNG